MPGHAFTTIPQLLAATVDRVKAQPALGTIHNGELTWQNWNEIRASVHRFAAGLQQAGVTPGDRVAHCAPNSPAWIITDLAILSLGAVHVPLHASLAKPQLSELLQLAEPKLAVVPAGNSALRAESRLALLSYDDLASTQQPPHLDTSIAPARLATLLFTSGTTGQPSNAQPRKSSRQRHRHDRGGRFRCQRDTALLFAAESHLCANL